MILATNIAETSVTIAGIVYGRCWWVWLVGVVWHPPPSYIYLMIASIFTCSD